MDILCSPTADRDEVYTAMFKLREIGREVVPRLLSVVDDEGLGPGARARAVELLGDLGGAEAVPVLVRLLKSAGVQVRWTAATVLGRLGDRSALPALREAQADGGALEVAPGFVLRVADAAVSALARLESAGQPRPLT